MDYTEIFEVDNEAVESAFRQIHYYINLPKHIKGNVSELNDIRPNSEFEVNSPAYVIEGTKTVKMGKMNIPEVNYSNTNGFLNRTVTF